MVRYYVKTDGASRGNPGHSGYGCVLENEDGDILAQLKGYINDKSTNNESEYIAARKGLIGLHNFINENPEGYVSFDVDVTLFSDSELLVKQMSGEYKVKNERMRVLHEELGSTAEDFFASVKFMHIKRGYNSMADRLANDAIDDFFRQQGDVNE
jgi:ribonuclease HI